MKPPHVNPCSYWIVTVECIRQVVQVSTEGEGFFIPGQEPLWDFSHVQEWIAEIPICSAFEAFLLSKSQPVTIQVKADEIENPPGTEHSFSYQPQPEHPESWRPGSNGLLPGKPHPDGTGGILWDDVPVGHRLTSKRTWPVYRDRADDIGRSGPVPTGGQDRKDLVLTELPLYVWTQTIGLPLWAIRAAMVHPTVHKALSEARLDGIDNPILLTSQIGETLCKDNERLRSELIDAIAFGRLFQPPS